MADIDIRIPQLGEGLQEARIVRFLKEVGDSVRQDEPIYEMETDKAVMEIESPTSGIIASWNASVDDVVPIGQCIGILSTQEKSAAVSTETDVISSETDRQANLSGPDGQLHELRIPQLGEGLQEARIVRFMKTHGESVRRDEPIYEMETDKAVMEIESPQEGILVNWLASEDDVLPIGAVVGIIRLNDYAPRAVSAVPQDAPTQSPPPSLPPNQKSLTTETQVTNAVASPRTTAYAREKGFRSEQLLMLYSDLGRKLQIADIDSATGGPASEPHPHSDATFTDSVLPPRQKTLNYRMQNSLSIVVPATMEMEVQWENIEAERRTIKKSGKEGPSQFAMFAYCVAQAVKLHPRFISALTRDGNLRQYKHLNLGLAVAMPGDELLMARIDAADTLSFVEFTASLQSAITLARTGKDQSSETMQLSITSMAGAGVSMGIPILVAPAAGTLFIGSSFDRPVPDGTGGIRFERTAKMVLTFDHRLVNGVGASKFLSDIRHSIETFRVPEHV